jgi:hypothetical protein
LNSGPTPLAILPVVFVMGFFKIGSHELFACAGFELKFLEYDSNGKVHALQVQSPGSNRSHTQRKKRRKKKKAKRTVICLLNS